MRLPIRIKIRTDHDPQPDDGGPVRDDIVQGLAPSDQIIKAGVARFREYANRHWPTKQRNGDFKLESFDHKNDEHLRLTLCMVYMAMRDSDHDA
jgi:hypothetical protein